MSVVTDPYSLTEEITDFTFHVETQDENGDLIKIQETSRFIFTDV